jgi:hypothetical protein
MFEKMLKADIKCYHTHFLNQKPHPTIEVPYFEVWPKPDKEFVWRPVDDSHVSRTHNEYDPIVGRWVEKGYHTFNIGWGLFLDNLKMHVEGYPENGTGHVHPKEG